MLYLHLLLLRLIVIAGRKKVNVVFSEVPHDTYLLRQWIATNGCGDKVTAQQFIYYEKEAPTNSLHFVGDFA